MDPRVISAVLLIIAMALASAFGCIQQNAEKTALQKNAENMDDANKSAKIGSTSNNNNNNNNNASADASVSINDSGPDFQAMVSSSKPFECEFSTGGVQQKLYVLGKNLRSEVDAGGGCKNSISITKDGITYIGCSGKKITSNCDWLVFDSKKIQGGYVGYAGYNATGSGLSGITDMKCNESSFDESVFSVSGKTCDISR